MQDDFNLPLLRERLAKIQSGEIHISEITPARQTPFTANLAWPQINQYMYERDELQSVQASQVRRDLFEDLLATPDLRPAIPLELIRTFDEKRQRIHFDYSPATSPEFIDWLKERLLLTETEWQQLTQAVQRDHPSEYQSLL